MARSSRSPRRFRFRSTARTRRNTASDIATLEQAAAG
jgi:hypothetical protein